MFTSYDYELTCRLGGLVAVRVTPPDTFKGAICLFCGNKAGYVGQEVGTKQNYFMVLQSNSICDPDDQVVSFNPNFLDAFFSHLERKVLR